MADLSLTAANVVPASGSPSPTFETGVAGEAITAGQVVLKNSSNAWVLADANAADLKAAGGIAVCNAAANQRVVVQTGGRITLTGMTTGVPYYLSKTPGGICPFADVTTAAVVLLGFAASSTVLILNIVDLDVEVA